MAPLTTGLLGVVHAPCMCMAVTHSFHQTMQSYLLSHPTLLGVFEQPRQGVSVMPGPVVDLEKVGCTHTHKHTHTPGIDAE